MTNYYVGPGGSDSNDGLSYVNRKLTLNGAENVPVAAGDTIFVSPGAYRELLTIDVSGSSGNPISYIADVTGQNTDGVGGVVRITGSDNDQTATRSGCITATSRDYRTFRGFSFDTTTGNMVTLVTACSNWIIEDCFFGLSSSTSNQLDIAGTGITNVIRRCWFFGGRGHPILIAHGSTVDDSAHVIENCFFMCARSDAIRITRVGGIAIRNCTVYSCQGGIRVLTALSTGQTTAVNNCEFYVCPVALQAATVPATNEEITENYNNFFANVTDRTNVSTGANSVVYSPVFQPPLLLDGIEFPWSAFSLSQWSPMRRLAGTNMAADDMFGVTRPATDSKKSWGAIQHNDKARETTTKRTGAASIELADAGVHQMFVPTTNVSTTFSVYAQWEADYAGTLPSLTVKQPGQSDSTDTATGSSGTWEELSVTLTPAASPGYCVVEMRSGNTATSGSFSVYFDDLVVS